VTRFTEWHRCWASRWCAVVYTALIVLPVTQPFQVVTIADLFGATSHQGTVSLTASLGVARTDDTAVSTVPSGDNVDGLLRFEARFPRGIAVIQLAHPTILHHLSVRGGVHMDPLPSVLRV